MLNDKISMIQIEIDEGSGFCFGVTTAIKKAEEELAQGKTLYCLGDIVHNGMECERLREMGLITINHDEMRELHDVKVAPTETLGHVFPVCMSWLPESQRALQQIHDFAYRNCR